MFPQLYKFELENDFSQFMDWLHIFPVYKGKSSLEDEEEDESSRYMGKYKVRCASSHALDQQCDSVHEGSCRLEVKPQLCFVAGVVSDIPHCS